MRGRLRGDRGDVTLPGLLMASVLSLIVLGATLDTFAGAQSQSTELTARNDNQQSVRAASDEIAAALRNLASPTPEQPQAIDKATPYDIVFQDVDPAGPNLGQNTANVRRQRWCLDAGGTLYSQRQTWTTATVPAAPSTTACPGSGWGTTTVTLQKLTNREAVLGRSLFVFDSATLTDIAAVHVDMYLDGDVNKAPGEVRLSTGVFLRNQNRKPTASFTAVATAQGIVLNASASSDPEGQPLLYTWSEGSQVVATGVTATYPAASGTHAIRLEVQDPAGLTSTTTVQVVMQ